MKLLGYKWDPEKDELSPGLEELNLNKKLRGECKPNENPVKTIKDAERLLTSVKLTRSLIVGKISELYDPCGFFEPVKLQMKLKTSSLKGKEWDEVLPEQDQETWRQILKEYVNVVAEFAGGAAIYAGRETSPGIWSCSLLAAKSKMMKETIPRNELSAILLCAELAFMVKSALGSEVGEVIYVTDSTIALSWCSSESIKLRLFVYNRVMTILRLFEWTAGSKDDVLYHIDSSLNQADLLTKEHEVGVSTVSRCSEWIEGMHWMTLGKREMPLTSYKDLSLDKKMKEKVQVECFPELFLKDLWLDSQEMKDELDTVDEPPSVDHDFSVLKAKVGRGVAELLVDPVYHGWMKALRLTGYMQGWRTKFCHNCHLVPDQDCRICKLGEHRWDPRNETEKAEKYFFQWESERVKKVLKPTESKRFREEEGIVYDEGRLSPEFQFKTQDLD